MDSPCWGQLVCGPPGSGKSTYCRVMHDFLNAAGRKTVVVNLDPGNDNLPYPCAINLAELICLSDVADEFHLGPNGGMMYCMEYLEANSDWLLTQLRERASDSYILFDCPGQAELFTHHTAVFTIVQRLLRADVRLCGVNLVDAHHVTDPAKFIAVSLLSLTSMVRLEMPHVNVLSKIDIVSSYGPLLYGLDFYTDVTDLSGLVRHVRDATPAGRMRRHARLQRHKARASAAKLEQRLERDGHITGRAAAASALEKEGKGPSSKEEARARFGKAQEDVDNADEEERDGLSSASEDSSTFSTDDEDEEDKRGSEHRERESETGGGGSEARESMKSSSSVPTLSQSPLAGSGTKRKEDEVGEVGCVLKSNTISERQGPLHRSSMPTLSPSNAGDASSTLPLATAPSGSSSSSSSSETSSISSAASPPLLSLPLSSPSSSSVESAELEAQKVERKLAQSAAASKTAVRRQKIFFQKYKKLNEHLAQVVEDFSLLSYVPLTLKDPGALLRLAKIVDKSNGFVPRSSQQQSPSSSSSFSAAGGGGDSSSAPFRAGGVDQVAATRMTDWDYEDMTRDMAERYMKGGPKKQAHEGGEEEEEEEEDATFKAASLSSSSSSSYKYRVHEVDDEHDEPDNDE